MGGMGSGRQGWLPVIENGLRLDLRRLRRQGLFNPAVPQWSTSIQWRDNDGEKRASITMTYSTVPDDMWLRLEYAVTRDGERTPVSETFGLERVEQPFGGFRWFIRCPQTWRRCQVLYLPPGATRFRSRQGFRVRLQYRSQQKAPFDRMLSRRDRAAEKVLHAGPLDWRKKYQDWDFPPKPPWMRKATYERHYVEWERCETWTDDFLAQYVAKLGGI